MTNNIFTAGIYVRVSSEIQVEKYSLPAQREVLIQHCKNMGWQYTIYEDAGISGETIDARPAMVRLLKDAQNRRFQVCLVTELERLSRSEDLFDWLLIKKTFRDNKIKIATPTQMFDLDDDEDDFLSDLFGALSKREKKKMIKRMMRGKFESVKRGKYAGGDLPYAYDLDRETGNFVINEERAEVIRLIFKLCIEDNLPSRKIAKVLTKLNIPTKSQITGKPNMKHNPRIQGWYSGSVYGILTNPIYMGKFAYYKKKGSRKRRPKEEWIYGDVPAIVSEEIFTLAQKRLRDRKALAKRNVKYDYLLSGLLRCRECGSRFQAWADLYKERIYPYYKCNGRVIKELGHNCQMPGIRVELLDRIVWDTLKDAIKRPDIIESAILERKAILSSDDIVIRQEHLTKALEKVQIEEERVLTAYREGITTLEQFRRELEKVNQHKAQLLQEKAELEASNKELLSDRKRAVEVKDLFGEICNAIDNLDFAQRQKLVRLLVDAIWIDINGKVEIECVMPFVESERLQLTNLLEGVNPLNNAETPNDAFLFFPQLKRLGSSEATA